MRLAIVAAAVASACSGAPSDGADPNSGQPSGAAITLTPRQVEAAHLQQLNRWIAEQDRVKPPAPSVAKPSRFSEARCVATTGNIYTCTYSYFEGEREQEVTASFVRNGSGAWSIR